MENLKELATGLAFPEGPIAMLDGSVLLVEIKRGTLTRVCADGKVEVVAQIGGGPKWRGHRSRWSMLPLQ